MYRLLLTLCLGEFVFPAIVAAAAAPPATPAAETRARSRRSVARSRQSRSLPICSAAP